jgi:FkbM family methyltransferase
MYSLSTSLSRRLMAYFFGADHKAKMRLFNYGHRLAGSPRFTVAFGAARLSLDINDYLQFEILRTGDFEPEVWSALAAYCQHDEVVWDVGANVGSVGIRAAQDPRVREVHCFEPNPRTFECLVTNQRLNPSLALEVHDCALGTKSGVQSLYVGLENNRGVAGFYPHWTSQSVPVLTLSGDDVVAQGICPPPTLLKIDVEGYELEVLRGMEKTLRAHPPKAIVFEGHMKAGGGTHSQAILDFLAELGMASRLSQDYNGRETVNFIATPRAL